MDSRMTDEELCSLGVSELLHLYRTGALSPVEVVSAHLQRIKRLNPSLNAFISVQADDAMAAAVKSEELFRTGDTHRALEGVPISVKDMIRVQHTRTTAASRVLMDAPPDAVDAAVVKKLRSAGAIILGKTNLHEFASGAPDPLGPFGVVHNPRRLDRTAGMSSSGSGAAVAAGMGILSVGTDTGGSVRIPAHFCGVVGFKPTTGSIDMTGVIPLSASLDCVGLLGRSVADIESTWRVCISERFSPSREEEPAQTKSWRIAVLRDPMLDRLAPEVAAAYQRSLTTLRMICGDVQELFVDGLEEMADITLDITQAEAAAHHERFAASDDRYGAGFLQNRLIPGREMKAIQYLDARRRQAEFQRHWMERFSGLDAVILPTCPLTAPLQSESIVKLQGQHIDYRRICGCFTRLFNCLGWPAISIPNGIDSNGLPSSIQIAAPAGGDRTIMLLGKLFEEAHGAAASLGISPQMLGDASDG